MKFGTCEQNWDLYWIISGLWSQLGQSPKFGTSSPPVSTCRSAESPTAESHPWSAAIQSSSKSSQDYPLTAFWCHFDCVDGALPLAKSCWKGDHLIKGHEECVDGALPLAKSCWMGDHLSAARRCCSSSRAAPLVLVVCPPPPVLLTLDPHSNLRT